MTENAIRKKSPSNFAIVKGKLEDESTIAKFTDIVGDKAPQFLASVVNAMQASKKLMEAEPASILSAAYIAATFDLPVDGNLGYSAIVPFTKRYYNKETNEWESTYLAQFQIMYKGFVQLAARTGSYETMGCTEVYKDEIVGYNPITEKLEFVTDFSKCTQRAEENPENIDGFYAYFVTKKGYRKEIYWTKDKVMRHAEKYSEAYKYDLKKKTTTSIWSKDIITMGKKTVLKMLLSKWGELSMDSSITRAIEEDQKVYDVNGNGRYMDNERPVEKATDPFSDVEMEVIDNETD